MLIGEEAVQLETGFTTEELEELLSFLQSNDQPASPNSGSDGSIRAIYSADERNQRRKISNRESAKRSRWRKKRHLEDLTDEVNRLNIENQQLRNRLSVAMNQTHVVWRENEQLRSESEALWAQLLDLYWTLTALQSPQLL